MTRVLIIEDDTKTAAAIREGLQLEGYEAVAVTNGVDGVVALRTSSFDALILDWMLPKYSGIDILKDLRANLGFQEWYSILRGPDYV